MPFLEDLSKGVYIKSKNKTENYNQFFGASLGKSIRSPIFKIVLPHVTTRR
jgi:hypothetical protein